MTHVENMPDTELDVLVGDQITNPIEFHVSRLLNFVTVLSTQSVEANSLTLAPGHGVVVENYIELHSFDDTLPAQLGRRFTQSRVIDVTGDVITFNKPMGYASSPATIKFAKRVTVSLNVIGTLASPIEYSIGPPNGFEWDITQITLNMILATQPDDSEFGDISGGIANGMYFGRRSDIFEGYSMSINSNSELRETAYDIIYVSRSVPAGSYGLSMRKKLAGQDNYGVAMRLTGPSNDLFVIGIQDDLSDIVDFHIKLLGHHTTKSGTLVHIP